MLNFTDHMKRIIVLAEHTLRHAKAGEFKPAADDLINISINCNEAMQQLDEFNLLKHQGKYPAGKVIG